MKQKYLFLFTISPVQAFITQARKAQDLYAGSLILSDLMKKVHSELKNNGAKIIFPQLPDKNTKKEEYEKSSATHRILAEITDTSIGQKLEKFVKDEFIKLSNSALDEIVKKYNKQNNPVNPENLSKQINDFLQVYWVAKEIENEEFNYSEIERLLGAVKNVRAFEQLNEPAGRKCSLCGERNVVFYKPNLRKENGVEKEKPPAFIDETQSIKIERNNHSLNQGEGLCAVCATKRFYETKTNFPSTTIISLFDMLNNAIENDKTLNSLIKFLENFRISHNESWILKIISACQKNMKINFNGVEDFDDQYFYEENISEKNIPDNKIRNKIKTAQKNFSKALKDAEIPLTKYYALIRFDGDSMGKLMAGDFLKEEHKSDLKAFQVEVSELLSEYAIWATGHLKEPFGKAIFAGGDDFLGFVNLHYLFDVLAELRQGFDRLVNQKIRDKITQDFTFSAGVTIAHYKTPLHAVLERTRKMEHDAKQVDGKDAFAIAVMKHSGEIHETVLEWNNGENAKTISFILDNMRTGDFSSTFIQSMNAEFLKLLDEDGKTTLSDDLIKTELKRLLNRASKNNLENKKEKVQELSDKIISLYQGDNLKDLLSLLSICDFIVRKTN